MADHTPKANLDSEGGLTIPTISASLSHTHTPPQQNGHPPIANNNCASPNTLSDSYHLNSDSGNVVGRKNSRLSLRGFGHFLRKNSRQEDDRKYSLAQLTTEALPRLDNYRISKRNMKRPSIGELHGELQEQSIQMPDLPPESNSHSIKLGWINGVVIPCLLNIWGVMLFLRLSWVVAESGILQSLIIIGISAVVCVITTLSLSAISTNGEVKGGGVYFIISRSLGPEFGASVGVVFAFANAVAASMNTIGFCDSLNDLLKNHGLKIIDGGINDVRIVGVCTIVVLILICCVGMEWESKAQNFLIVTIVLAIFNFLIGSAIGPRGNEEAIAKGFVGFSWSNFKENFGGDYRFSEGVNQDFFSVFAIYFPSVTGIQAGANICGDLKDPGAAIPKGTFWALMISMFSYAVFVLFAGGAAARDASGNVADLINGTLISSELPCKVNLTCNYGLHNSYSVMQLMSVWGPLIYAGCFAATLSTALTNILSVPRLVQALGIDRIYPGLIFFSKPYGKHGEPYRGYVLTFIISAGFLLIGELNVIAPLISNFYLASYALINFCTFHASFVKPLGWRPTFKYYNTWLSLFGFILCIAIMFLIDWISSLITLVIIFALYLIVMYRKPEANWGSSTQEQQYKATLTAVHRLQNVSDHVKNYHPQILVLSGDPSSRPPLIDFGNMLTRHNSLMFIGNVVPMSMGYKNRLSIIKDGQKYLDARKIKAFYNVIDGLSMEEGVNALLKSTGFGKLTPNIVLMGYKTDWAQCRRQCVESYFNILYNAFSQRMGVVILRLPNGLEFSELNPEIPSNGRHVHNANELGYTNALVPSANAASELLHVDSNLNLAGIDSTNSSFMVSHTPSMPNMTSSRKYTVSQGDGIKYLTKSGSEVPKDVLDAVTVFLRKQPKGTVDVFWLYDDGGLTMLLPYILSLRSNYQNCKLRVFALSHGKDEEMEEKNMANLLKKFRIKFSELIMLKGLSTKPRVDTLFKHRQLIQNYCHNSANEMRHLEEELHSLEEKTHRQLRIHELVVEHSSQATLVVMSLPMPRREAISAALYMSWLEMLTADINCPVVLARGNQTPVLTFYS
ncbi:PREDICTED: bumetanide-sensitive sodium-(potassium)-chloride cotransporter [Rhagoletis zephyria]|uniref:bumetanide-sensitive sodium-(potassium)-chloride cotransporter n=1 Tax=Rhagoletis zephyria TaxID=28612 RepID=UPI00081198F9|nr:PREDICTED: bumetanide-sensitive sodium-(potassium)-chloride cotransporter [Rhagoletis zephyria]